MISSFIVSLQQLRINVLMIVSIYCNAGRHRIWKLEHILKIQETAHDGNLIRRYYLD